MPALRELRTAGWPPAAAHRRHRAGQGSHAVYTAGPLHPCSTTVTMRAHACMHEWLRITSRSTAAAPARTHGFDISGLIAHTDSTVHSAIYLQRGTRAACCPLRHCIAHLFQISLQLWPPCAQCPPRGPSGVAAVQLDSAPPVQATCGPFSPHDRSCCTHPAAHPVQYKTMSCWRQWRRRRWGGGGRRSGR